MRGIDLGAQLGAGSIYALWCWFHPLGVGVYEMLLSCVAVFLFRAVVVPATWRRTFLVTTLGCLPGIAAAVLAPTGGSPARGTLVTIVFSWSMVTVGFASLASATFHGLRRAVRDARRIGQYTLVEQLGAGGMGIVYLARHALLRRPTALKLLHPERTTPEASARFEREVQLTSEIMHPNVVTIFDYGRTESGGFYYVMEYLDGWDLERLVSATGPMPPARVRHVLLQVCAALSEAHARGLIHRDIKPANVILAPRRGGHDVAKVCDFGLVKDLRYSGPNDTHAQTILGTPLYLAPEAVKGQALDARSDLYSVGALAYQLLTGRPVFDARSAVEVCAHHLHTIPKPPSALGVSVPIALEDVVLRCLAKRPEDRFPTARALGDVLLGLAEVGEWTEDEATAFWEAHQERLADHRARVTVSPLSDTVQVALVGRERR